MATAMDKALEELDRHAQRRERNIPALSVLAGPPALGLSCWREWARAAGRPILLLSEPDPDALAKQWVDAVFVEHDSLPDAFRFLATGLERTATELEGVVARMTRHELDLFLKRAFPGGPAEPVARLCAFLVECRGEEVTAEHVLDCLPTNEEPFAALVDAASQLLSASAIPATILVQGGSRPAPDWVAASSRMLADLAMGCPPVAFALAVRSADFEEHMAAAPESRAKALCREGVIPIGGLDTEDVCTLLQEDLDRSIRRLVEDGATGELIAAYEAAAACTVTGKPGTREEDDRARSEAERFLYLRLETLPETAGLFELNGLMAFPFGRMPRMEVDLVSREFKIAIEIDGYYHFQDHYAYRRDRYKDFILQKKGFMVLRFLADDVVVRQEHVQDVILETLSIQRMKDEG